MKRRTSVVFTVGLLAVAFALPNKLGDRMELIAHRSETVSVVREVTPKQEASPERKGGEAFRTDGAF